MTQATREQRHDRDHETAPAGRDQRSQQPLPHTPTKRI
jgi:hypothetical protein